ncbi:CobW family GTP-binding protein [Neptunicoccus cionae]|uniref:Cobalamin biosynthesis protein CobW n=1 Tax=Neptunicoccus cionae TaxID=2035344 RepID=A0A916R421_9RHOB|nr:CobW family GTP-binding protein [Amylibacter cionae]GGA26372.1 cobalamin biosynthesis protein CobW [Amylibacter cionae]
MSVPVLLVTGFLGAGKTTFINRLLQQDHGRRIAAIVNDFGSINIDAALLDSSADGVIGLKNGCICCSLQGDLMRTLRQVLSRDPVPDLIVIEASGVADPAGITQSLMDPVIWTQARLETVIGIIDATDSARQNDPLWLAQLRGSDVLCLSKTAIADGADIDRLRLAVSVRGNKLMLDMEEPIPLEALFIGDAPSRNHPTVPVHPENRFCHLEWRCNAPMDLQQFQTAITTLAPMLLRAKGFVQFKGQSEATLFQLAGNRVALSRAPEHTDTGSALVLIGERGAFEPEVVQSTLDRLAPH